MNVIISGTSSGIGRELALHLGGAGHGIWGLARRTQEDLAGECRARDISFRSSVCDVSQWAQVEAARQAVSEAWPSVDALVCCAAVQGPIGPATQIEPTEWTKSLAVNLNGAFFTIRAFFDMLRRADRRAKIVCFSGGGSTSPRPNFSAYAVAKSGVVRLVENLAQEWQGLPIDINAIAPGPVNTAMTRQVLSAGAEVAGAKEYQAALAQTGAGGTPREKYASLTEFLLGPDSDGISGRLISAVWDPWPTLARHKEQLQPTDIYTLRRIVPKDRGHSFE